MDSLLLHSEFHSQYDPAWLDSKLISPLYDHQKTFLAWAKYREENKQNGCAGGFLLDEPGLGKTRSMLALIHVRKLSRITLIVCPSHLIKHWIDELHLGFKPAFLSYSVYYGHHRHTTPIDFEHTDCIFTSYGTVRSDFASGISDAIAHNFPREQYPFAFPGFRQDSVFRHIFGRIVYDEAQNFRNSNITYRSVFNLIAGFNWCITATPIMNRVQDLYNLISVLGIAPYNCSAYWDNHIASNISRTPVLTFNTIMNQVMIPFSIRRLKSNLDMVPRNENMIWVHLNQEENQLYNYLLDYTRIKVEKVLKNMEIIRSRFQKLSKFVKRMKFGVIVFILRLRQCCCHPQLVINRILKTSLLNNTFNEAIVQMVNQEQKETPCSICLNGNKIYMNTFCCHQICKKCYTDYSHYNLVRCPLCNTFIPSWNLIVNEPQSDIKEEEENIQMDPMLSCKVRWVAFDLSQHQDKVIIVSQWIEFLQIFEKYFIDHNITYIWLGGSIPAHSRYKNVDKFQSDPSIRICLLSLSASSEGINLTAACRVYHVDPWWNESKSTQASDRVHRLGQTNEVFITHLRVKDTIEEAIEIMRNQKADISHVIVGKKSATDEMTWANNVRLLLAKRESEAYIKK